MSRTRKKTRHSKVAPGRKNLGSIFGAKGVTKRVRWHKRVTEVEDRAALLLASPPSKGCDGETVIAGRVFALFACLVELALDPPEKKFFGSPGDGTVEAAPARAAYVADVLGWLAARLESVAEKVAANGGTK